jgi:hypothetical protein
MCFEQSICWACTTRNLGQGCDERGGQCKSSSNRGKRLAYWLQHSMTLCLHAHCVQAKLHEPTIPEELTGAGNFAKGWLTGWGRVADWSWLVDQEGPCTRSGRVQGARHGPLWQPIAYSFTDSLPHSLTCSLTTTPVPACPCLTRRLHCGSVRRDAATGGGGGRGRGHHVHDAAHAAVHPAPGAGSRQAAVRCGVMWCPLDGVSSSCGW